MDEFDLIDRCFRPLATHPCAHGLRDDGASLPSVQSGYEWRISTDTLIEDVHFKKGMDLRDLAWRALAVNVSDLVAQLATPKFYMLNLSQPAEFPVEEFAVGLGEAQGAFDISLLGGDTTCSSGPVAISITVIGVGRIGKNPLRSNARAGQGVFLLPSSPGVLGAAKAGFDGVEAYKPAFFRPATCFASLPALLEQEINAMVDISDGVLQDLGHLCHASSVGANVHLTTLPLAIPDQDPLPQICWGDDYGLVLTAESCPQVPGIIKIGELTSETGVRLLDDNMQEVQVITSGYVHGHQL